MIQYKPLTHITARKRRTNNFYLLQIIIVLVKGLKVFFPLVITVYVQDLQ